jgi:hypothetical protein
MKQNLDCYPLPSLVLHVDWRIHPRKRIMTRAIMNQEGHYSVNPPEMVEDLDRFFGHLITENDSKEGILVGFEIHLDQS